MIYTRDNPKLVEYCSSFEGKETFTGVVKDVYNTVAYYVNGKWHREDGPAVEFVKGYKEWHLNGEFYGDGYDFTNESWIRFVNLELLK